MTSHLYQDEWQNAVRISDFEQFEGETTFQHVAAKFVVSGEETYLINGKKFHVNTGEYLIGNNNLLSEVIIKNKTKGLCIDISTDIITEIIQTKFDNADLAEFICTDKFLVNKYYAEHTHLGHSLFQVTEALHQHPTDRLFSSELFYSIGEHIVIDQSLIFEQFSKLNYKKPEVNEEVFRNLLNSKQYMDAYFLNPIGLEELVNVAFMSKYAYIRLFKHTFGVTPYQYLLQKRLQHAKTLVMKGEKITEVALKTGFADTPTFSKAFKHFFGHSPTQYCK